MTDRIDLTQYRLTDEEIKEYHAFFEKDLLPHLRLEKLGKWFFEDAYITEKQIAKIEREAVEEIVKAAREAELENLLELVKEGYSLDSLEEEMKHLLEALKGKA